jgi:hypothetical protein
VRLFFCAPQLKAKAALAEIPFPACPYSAEFPGALARAGYLAIWAECPVPVSWVRLPSLTPFTGKIWTNVVVPKTRSTASWRTRLPRPTGINPPVLISSEVAHLLQHHRKPGIFGNNGRSGAAADQQLVRTFHLIIFALAGWLGYDNGPFGFPPSPSRE